MFLQLMLLSVICLTLSNSNWVAGPIYHASRARWIISRSEPQAMLKLSIMWALRIVSAFVKKKKTGKKTITTTHWSNSQGCHPARKWNCCCRFSSAWAIIYLLLLWRRWLRNTRPAGTVAPPIFSLSLYLFPLSLSLSLLLFRVVLISKNIA